MFAEISGDAAPSEKPGEAAPAAPKAGPPAEPKPAPAPEAAQTPPATPPAPESGAPAKAEEKPSHAAAKPAKEKNGTGVKPETKAKPEAKPEAPAGKPAAAPKAKPVAAKAKPEAKPAPAPAKATAAVGRVIRVIGEEKPGVYELAIQTTKPPASYTKMFLTNPPRMVLDIAGLWDYHGASASDTGGDFIRRIRIGRHKDLFRVVLDMAPDAPARLRGAPTVSRSPEGVVLRIPK
ncbi:conserved hypothetical protein [Solidesulfovibrio fructosivorans JJ]]|uniref:AMIN domain-containing protein n=1 Tax=Solidesulfovibrio fructosivorans JJ] TaxID=596151 RepID=E1JV35_SOLFR|nr:AMIN domain-containing protein [Solidesulfovibrio fructosivorans]EFL51629.1 conserved hypothetical protein [Solidesulfovibrio fructosivorans JJ]]